MIRLCHFVLVLPVFNELTTIKKAAKDVSEHVSCRGGTPKAQNGKKN